MRVTDSTSNNVGILIDHTDQKHCIKGSRYSVDMYTLIHVANSFSPYWQFGLTSFKRNLQRSEIDVNYV